MQELHLKAQLYNCIDISQYNYVCKQYLFASLECDYEEIIKKKSCQASTIMVKKVAVLTTMLVKSIFVYALYIKAHLMSTKVLSQVSCLFYWRASLY